MKHSLWDRVPLRWRLFIATSTTITALFALAAWVSVHYTLAVADQSIRSELRAGISAYEGVWKSRTQLLSATTSLMAAMSDVRAAFMTRDPRTIRDSTQELWSRVSGATAGFFVLDAEGRLISSLNGNAAGLDTQALPIRIVSRRFPSQVSGFVRQGTQLFYTVFTPVYVQSSAEPLLLNVLCAAFRVDDRLTRELKQLTPDTDFVFAAGPAIFASTASPQLADAAAARRSLPGYIVANQILRDVNGAPIANLLVVHSYAHVQRSLRNLQTAITLAWLLTMALGLFVSSFLTRRLLFPVKLLDFAATRFAARDYGYRVPVRGSGELPRLARTFNAMCDSIQQAQAELVRQEQMAAIARLGSSLVHDLRNPLAAIYGGAEMLIDCDLAPDQSKRIARNIHRASQRMQDLLRDLLNLSKQQSRPAEFCDLRDIIDAAIESVSLRPDIHIQIDIPQGAEVLCDRIRVERVFTNLFANAIDAMPNGGRIVLHAEKSGTGLKVVVEDDGPGVPERIRPSLFKPFVTGKPAGLGLGLALSKQSMLEAGGDLVLADAKERAAGARFRVEFSQFRSGTRSDPRVREGEKVEGDPKIAGENA